MAMVATAQRHETASAAEQQLGAAKALLTLKILHLHPG
jgi:hypothetical protein